MLYFAAARDVTQIASEDIAVPDEQPWTLQGLTRHLETKYGEALQRILDQSMYAVNMAYVDKKQESSTLLKANDEIAIIPPVSGG